MNIEFGIIRKIISDEDIDFLKKLYSESSNNIIIDGSIKERYTINTRFGFFLLSHFTYEETKKVSDKILNKLKDVIGYDISVSYFRILKYLQNCWIDQHLDATSVLSPSNFSIIIQLSESNDFNGGEFILNGNEIKLNKGDCVYYSYHDMHGVTPVIRGERIVVNMRCNVKDKNNLI